MKNITFLLAIALLFTACQKDNNPPISLAGDWALVEVLLDPGDGSGTFEAVPNDKIITFHSNGTITSNGNLCDLSIGVGQSTAGTYSATQSTFQSNDCYDPNQEYTFVQDGTELIISYPCFEACQAKYRKR